MDSFAHGAANLRDAGEEGEDVAGVVLGVQDLDGLADEGK
jgi:hypothetical protein